MEAEGPEVLATLMDIAVNEAQSTKDNPEREVLGRLEPVEG